MVYIFSTVVIYFKISVLKIIIGYLIVSYLMINGWKGYFLMKTTPKFRLNTIFLGMLAVCTTSEMAFANTNQSSEQESTKKLDIETSSKEISDVKQLQTIVVTAVRDQAETSFKADRSDTATRNGVSLQETPGSITVITGKVLESQQALSVQDALRNVSGVIFDETPQGNPSLSIRGFADSSLMVNGVSDQSALLTDVNTVERLEVLKGPQAILSGANALGGAVNVVTKKPQAAPLHSIQLQYGTHDDASAAFDATGAITSNEKLSYRIIASKAKAQKSEAGFNGRDDVSILPQLRWKDDKTDFIVGVSYAKQYEPLLNYTFAKKGQIIDKPNFLLGMKKDGFDTEQKRAFYQLEQQINPYLTFISRLQASKFEQEKHVYNASTSVDGNTLYLSPLNGLNKDKELSGDHYFRIEGDTGSVSHKLSVGISHRKYDSTSTDYTSDLYFSLPYASNRIDLLDPREGISPYIITDVKSNQYGFFAQDLLTWKNWNLLLNFRRTHYDTITTSTMLFDPSAPEVSSDGRKKEWVNTPGVGLIYNITPEFSVYANYAKGFSPTLQTMCNGGVTDPTETENKEVGTKFDLLNSKLSLTSALFEVNESNTLAYDTQGCVTQLAGQTTKGVELDLQGEILTGWNISANYTYNKYKDQSNPDRIFAAQPKHKLSVWTTYELQHATLNGLGFGLGLSALSNADGERNVNEARGRYAFKTAGGASVDFSVFYKKGPWNTTLGIKNLFDKEIYQSATNSFVRINNGRSATFTVKRTF